MGREGVAYTFVTTEEGGELTRIEMLINRLLKRDEIEGFNSVATTIPDQSAVTPTTAAPASTGAPSEQPQQKPAPPLPPGRRPPKRHRRAL
jgi:ATP-dependent RNA helicase DeaD